MKHNYVFLLLCMFAMLSFQAQNVNIPDPVFKDYLINYQDDFTLEYLDVNGDNEIQVSEAETITYIDIYDDFPLVREPIYDLTGIEAFINIEYLYIEKFRGSIVDFSHNTLIEKLNITGSQIQNIDLSNNINLSEIFLQNNQLSSIIFPDDVILSELVLYNNQLTTLDLRNMGNIGSSETINISRNKISSFLFNDNQLRARLSVSGNLLTSLDLSKTSLLGLNVNDNYHLQYLNVAIDGNITGGDRIDEIYANGCPNLSIICVFDTEQWSTPLLHADQSTNVLFTEDCSITEGDFNQILGSIAFDNENDGCDVNDTGMSGVMVQTTDGTDTFSTTSYANGFFAESVIEGTYTVSLPNLPSYFDVTPITQNVTFTGYNNTETLDFCVTANQSVDDVNVTILPIREARPGFDTEYKLIYKNVGTTTQSGTVTFQFDDTLQTLVSANPIADATTVNALSFNYTDLQPFESGEILITLNIFPPTTVNGGDVLPLLASITPTANDANLDDNSFSYNHFVVNSYDPNDKQVLQGSEITEPETDNYLDYLIRFQNTGTASAINVSVADELNDKLDWNTFQMVSASHPYEVNITNGNFVQFVFDGINLPAEQDDEPASHGYIAFKIKPKTDVVVGDIITGQANIYFDFNAPIITNEVSTEVVTTLSNQDIAIDKDLKIYPNPVQDRFRIKTATGIEVESVSVFSITGEKLFETNDHSEIYNLDNYASGIYFVKVMTNKGEVNKRLIKK